MFMNWYVGPFEDRADGPNVSAPERAFLELLTEARELAESTYSLRAWAKKLNPARLPAGGDRPWISQTNEGLLVLKK